MADNPMTLERIANLRDLLRDDCRFSYVADPTENEQNQLLDLAETALKQPRTQWQPRITRQQAELSILWRGIRVNRAITFPWFIARLRELGLEVEDSFGPWQPFPEPPEASREC